MEVSEYQISFTYNKLTKTWRRGQKAPKVTFHTFSNDKGICVVNAITEYLKRTSQLRVEDKATQLFLSTLKPHNPVSRHTIARWLKQILYAAGISTDTFTAYSTRSASSSKANMQGAKFEEILNRGSKSSTWQNHYRREVVSKEDSGKTFQEHVYRNNNSL